MVDYREINKKTRHKPFPLPNLFHSLQSLHGSTRFSQLDLNLGYYQIPLNEQSVLYSAFTLCGRTYEYLRMPYGLKNAPHTFQRTMTQIFGTFGFVLICLDDILVHSKSEREHFEHVKTVLETAHQHGVSINFEKSTFNRDSMHTTLAT